MNTDKQFVQYLKGLSTDVPSVDVDRRHILAAGRRRRATRATGVSLAVGALGVGLVASASAWLPGSQPTSITPAASTSAPLDAPEPAEPTAVVDEAEGTVTLPLDAWVLSPADLAMLDTVRELYTSRCMVDAGYGDDVFFVGEVPPRPGREFAYGAWRTEDLEANGYRTPNTESPNRIRTHTEAAQSASRDCHKALLNDGLTYEPGDFEEEAPTAAESFDRTDEGRAIIAEWAQCLQDHDVTPPTADEGMLPGGMVGATLAEQVRVGRIDIACKQELNIVQRLADVDAATQNDYIDRAKPYLEHRRSVEQEVLTNARAYLDETGLQLEPR